MVVRESPHRAEKTMPRDGAYSTLTFAAAATSFHIAMSF